MKYCPAQDLAERQHQRVAAANLVAAVGAHQQDGGGALVQGGGFAPDTLILSDQYTASAITGTPVGTKVYLRGRSADDGLRAQTGTLALDFAFQADEGGQAERDHEFDDLPRALPGAAEKGGIRQPFHGDKLTRGDDFWRLSKSVCVDADI